MTRTLRCSDSRTMSQNSKFRCQVRDASL